MTFVDASGAVVARNSRTIAPGESVSFDLKFDAPRQDNRLELGALFRAERPPNPNKNLRTTIEVFDGGHGKEYHVLGQSRSASNAFQGTNRSLTFK